MRGMVLTESYLGVVGYDIIWYGSRSKVVVVVSELYTSLSRLGLVRPGFAFFPHDGSDLHFFDTEVQRIDGCAQVFFNLTALKRALTSSTVVSEMCRKRTRRKQDGRGRQYFCLTFSR